MKHIRGLGLSAGLATCTSVPLVLRGETIGVLATYRRELMTAPAAEDEDLLSILGDQAAIAVENATVYERLHAQTEAVRESEARFRLAFEDAPIGVALIGTDGRFLRVNNLLCEMVGRSREEMARMTVEAITHSDDRDADTPLIASLTRGEIGRYQLGKRYVRPDGATVDVQVSVAAVRDRDGAPQYFIAQIEDVSESKRIEAVLRRSEAQLRALIEQLPDGVFIHRGGPLIYVNRALVALLGCSPDELIRRSLMDLYHADDRAAVLDRLKLLASGKAAPPRELRMLRQDGSTCNVESTAIQVQFEDRPAFVVIVRDLTERKLAERERELAYGRLRAVLDLAPVGMMLSEDGFHWQGNARARQLLGRDIDASVDLSLYADAMLDVNGAPLTVDQNPGVRAFRGEKLDALEMLLRRPDDQLVPILVNAAAIPGASDGTRTVVVAFEDISALKELERLRIEWSARIAHDLRQPLNSIGLYAHLLARQTAADPTRHQHAVAITNLTRRLERMVQDLVDFTRLESRQLTIHGKTLDLTQIVREVTDRMFVEAPDRPIQLSVRGGPATVNADSDRLAQVMENLLTNAIKYGDAGSPIAVDVENTATAVTVSVTNRGPGISPGDLPHLFGRFARGRDTQRRGTKGIGLGLYITRELIEAHHGQIGAESVPGESTTFRFTLPRVLPHQPELQA
jgi:PAS domain S-box-containing protein